MDKATPQPLSYQRPIPPEPAPEPTRSKLAWASVLLAALTVTGALDAAVKSCYPAFPEFGLDRYRYAGFINNSVVVSSLVLPLAAIVRIIASRGRRSGVIMALISLMLIAAFHVFAYCLGQAVMNGLESMD